MCSQTIKNEHCKRLLALACGYDYIMLYDGKDISELFWPVS